MGTELRLDRGQIEVVDDEMADVLRSKTPAERIGIGFRMWISAHDMLMAHIMHMHPEWDVKRVESEVARRLLHGAVC